MNAISVTSATSNFGGAPGQADALRTALGDNYQKIEDVKSDCLDQQKSVCEDTCNQAEAANPNLRLQIRKNARSCKSAIDDQIAQGNKSQAEINRQIAQADTSGSASCNGTACDAIKSHQRMDDSVIDEERTHLDAEGQAGLQRVGYQTNTYSNGDETRVIQIETNNQGNEIVSVWHGPESPQAGQTVGTWYLGPDGQQR